MVRIHPVVLVFFDNAVVAQVVERSLGEGLIEVRALVAVLLFGPVA